MDYILGVDGGNTKTDYFLFDCEGNFIGMHRDGTCSHEALSDGFEGTRRVMKDALDYFLNRRKVKIEDIKAACFGLAGDDIPSQQRSLEEIISSFGFENFIVVNDSTLGIKAGTTKGYGVCSINGTGTSASGIDKNGKVLQVGGIGEVPVPLIEHTPYPLVVPALIPNVESFTTMKFLNPNDAMISSKLLC